MKRLNLIAGLFSSVIMLLGSIIPLMNGILFAFIDSVNWLFWSHYLSPENVEYRGGFLILGISIYNLIAALLVCLFSILAYVAYLKEEYFKCTVPYIITCLLSLLGVVSEAYYVTWLNTQTSIVIQYAYIYYIWPILNALALIVLVFFTILNLIWIRENE